MNVGGRTVKMERLRAIVESAGYANVETFISSGNVAFDSRSSTRGSIEGKLQAELAKSLGYPVAIFVRSIDEIGEIAARTPFGEIRDGSTLYIAFCAKPLSDATASKLLSLQTATDRFRTGGCELYWLCLGNFSDSAFSGPRLEKVLEMQVTVRNSTTIRKLAAKVQGAKPERSNPPV